MTQPAIRAEGLTKSFGSVQALAGVDLAVPPGTVLGLLGPNGAGKTTAVRILTTILRPDGGIAEVMGVDVSRHPQRVRERIGLAGQFAAVDENLTGAENLTLVGRLAHLPRGQIAGRVRELLDTFGLTDAADRPASTYSGGMRRRLDLAAALVHRPPVLFLDEPTTGLDPASRSDLWDVIAALVSEGSTLLLTTQYLEEADHLADRIAVIDHGSVIAEGTPAELKAGLGSTVVEATFADASAAARAARVIESAGEARPSVTGSALDLTVDDGARALVRVLRAVDAAGLDPVTVGVREPSLDDVFLALTGHRTAAATVDAAGGAPRDADGPSPLPDREPARGAA